MTITLQCSDHLTSHTPSPLTHPHLSHTLSSPQVRDLRERLDTATQSLSEREGRLRESEERGRERGEEAVRLGREMKEAATEIEQLKVYGHITYTVRINF